MMQSDTSVVLVHGAWADGSSWNTVIEPLQQRGFRVLTAAIPMTSLSDDRAALDRTIEQTTGPVVLPGHSYGGGVAAATAHRRVRALAFITAITPDEGESIGDMVFKEKPPCHGAATVPRCRRLFLDVV